MPSRHDLRPTPPGEKYGLPGVYYPTNDKTAYVVVIEEVQIGQRGYTPLAPYTQHPGTGVGGIAVAVLTEEKVNKGDGSRRAARRIYETLPGPTDVTSRIDLEDGSVITITKRPVRAIPENTATSSGSTTITYEPRGENQLVDIQTTTTTALDGVVRSSPVRVNLRLPRVLGGVAVSYDVSKGTGDDTSTGTAITAAGDNYSLRNSASASGNSSLGVSPQVFLPIRDWSDLGDDVPAYVKQVFVSGAVTEAAILARMTAVYEVIVTGTLTPDATGTYLGNSSNVGGVIWFSKASTARNLTWTAGVWHLGTAAEVLAGNDWRLTAGATAWLGSYTPHGTASGTLTVAIGRTVNAWPRWGTQEINLVTAGKQVSVRSNASASEDVAVSDGSVSSHSKSQTIGKSVSVGSNQGRVRIEPTLHGPITIANSVYTDSVNATATAGLVAIGPLVFAGVDSGFPSGTNALGNTQFATSYVRFSTAAATITPPALTITGNTIANPTIVTTSAPHGMLTGDVATITLSDSTPTINGVRTITKTGASAFSVAVNVSGAGTTGTVQGPSSSAATTIPATDPADVPQSGLYLMAQFQTSAKDAQYAMVNGTVVDMSVLASAPTFVSYSNAAPVYRAGVTITANAPYWYGGNPTSFSISPGIPSGMAFSTTTGIITGTPASGQNPTTYTVTATNGSGSVSGAIIIAVTA